ncbi:MAG: cytochrome c, partial [Anaerolineae bacterium]|nr:cytochrome c [Anaerolineae bacterium]
MRWNFFLNFRGILLRYGMPAALVLLLAACGGLSGEPRIIATIPPQNTPIPEALFPAAPPDLATGAQIFSARCTRCHGLTGKGDGELIGAGQNQIAIPPRDFTNPATTRDQTPAQWFATITNGRMEKFMPPWREELTFADRWAVAMYTYTLSYTADELAQGEDVFSRNGNGHDPLLTNQSQLVEMTDASLAATLNADLSPEDQRAVAAYMRTLSLANAGLIGNQETVTEPVATAEVAAQPASTPEVGDTTTAQSAVGIVTGKVSNGTAGGTVPADLTVTLHMLDMSGAEETQDAVTDADGNFIFTDVTLRDDRGYYVSTTYLGNLFGSDLNFGDPATGTLDFPVSIYETTNDPSGVVITGIVMQISPDTSGLQIALIIRFNNTSDRLFTGAEAVGENQYPSVAVTLPSGAQMQDMGDQQTRYVITGTPPTLTDTVPLLPGEDHIFHALYFLPYDGHLSIEQPFAYPVDGPVQVLISTSGLEVSSTQLAPMEPQDVSGVTYDRYGANLALAAGGSVQYTLDGNASTSPSASATSTTGTVIPSNTLPLLLALIGIAAIGLGLAFYWRDR